jgi:hypothetical protein
MRFIFRKNWRSSIWAPRKVKVNLSLYFSQLSTTPWRRIGEVGYSFTHSLTSALDGDEWSASRPYRFTPRERAPGTHYIAWVGPRAGLDAVVKRKISSPRRESNPRTPIAQPVAQSYSECATAALASRKVGITSALYEPNYIPWTTVAVYFQYGTSSKCVQKLPRYDTRKNGHDTPRRYAFTSCTFCKERVKA